MNNLLYNFCKTGLLLTVLVLPSCSHDPQGLESVEPVCFNTQVYPLILNSCAVSGCHNGGGEEGPDLTSYEKIVAQVRPGNPRQSSLYRVLTDVYGNLMPPHQPLAESDRNLIKIWIEQGAQNTVCNDTGGSGLKSDTVCFSQDILPLLSSSCAKAGCHDAVTAAEVYQITSYQNIGLNRNLVKPGSYNESKLYRVLIAGGEDRMPPPPQPPLTQAQIDKIKKWISDGALNSDCPAASCDTTGTISFSSKVWPVIQNNCLGCHPASGSSNGISLGTYAQVKNVAGTKRNGISLLSGSIHHFSGFSPMPQNGKLDDCPIAQIDKWISQGMPNN
jgi:ribosomal protein S16